MNEKKKLSPRAQRRKENRQRGKNKRLLRLNDRLRGYLAILEKLGYSGSTDLDALPRRWGGFTKPGVF